MSVASARLVLRSPSRERAARDFPEYLPVLRMFRTHQSVPPGEIETKVNRPSTTVMEIMMGGGREDAPEWVISKAGWIEFDATMAPNISYDDDREEREQSEQWSW